MSEIESRLLSFEGLMRLAQQGDRKAYAALFQAITPLLRSFVSNRIRDNSEAEDVVQEILLSVHRASHTYDTFHLLMPLYVCGTWEGEVTPREGQRIKWVRANRLREYQMPPADLPLIPMLVDLLG